MADGWNPARAGEHSDRQDSAYRDHRRLKPLRSRQDVENFLKDILESFRDKVDIVQTGLLDALYASRVLNDADNQSLAARHPTSREKARRLLTIMKSIDHEVFVNKALPMICRTAGFIIPDQYWENDPPHTGQEEQGVQSGEEENRSRPCTRCAITGRVRLSDLADFLWRIGLIDSQTHTEKFEFMTGAVLYSYRGVDPSLLMPCHSTLTMHLNAETVRFGNVCIYPNQTSTDQLAPTGPGEELETESVVFRQYFAGGTDTSFALHHSAVKSEDDTEIELVNL